MREFPTTEATISMRCFVVAVMTILAITVSGCAKQSPPDSQDTKQQASGSTETKAAESKPAAPAPGKRGPSLPVQLTGRSFTRDDKQPSKLEAGNMQLLQSYTSLSTQANLPADASKVTFKLKPRPTNNSFPVVSLLAERTGGGKYLRVPILDKEEVLNDQEGVRQVSLPKGTYKVTLQFFGSTGKDRSHLEIHRISFE